MIGLRTKTFLGLGFLFLLIVLLSVLGANMTHQMSSDTESILKDNFASVHYGYLMLNDLDQMQQFTLASADTAQQQYKSVESRFDSVLTLEAKNITEPGEAGLVERLKVSFRQYRTVKGWKSGERTEQLATLYQNIKSDIQQIYHINRQALIKRYNRVTKRGYDSSVTTLVIGGFSTLFALVFMVYFPGVLVNPLREITDKIDAISQGDYKQRVAYSSSDELGTLATSFNRMASKLYEFEQSTLSDVLAQKKRLETVLNSMSDAVFILNENKRVIMVNPASSVLSGLPESGLVDKHIAELAKTNDFMSGIVGDLIIPYGPADTVESKPIKVVVDNRELYFTKEIRNLSIKPASEKSTTLIGHLIILKDVTDIAEKDAAKTSFLATVSHELKTPISSINLTLKLLKDRKIGDLNEEQEKLISSVKQDTDRLNAFVKELLDFSQVESGNIRLNLAHVDLKELVDYAAEALRRQLDNKDLTIDMNMPDEPVSIKADPEKTVWVLTNLIGNAIRYSPHSSTITIHVSQNEKEVLISVRDQGPGIPKEYQNQIFEKFVQVGGDMRRGTGLGLAISKEFLQAQKGRIWLESEFGKGTTFTIALPVV
ncbi:MAG TPA: ATP-binding protein [Balneolales bacterium]|nr:ATP-binding protein [Balneolales bacterium]